MIDLKNIEEQILNDRVIFFTGEFNEENCDSVLKQLFFLDKKSKEDITIYLDSYGGYVTDFFKLYDVMNTLRSKINIIATGKAMSAGSMLLITGFKRYAYEHTEIMIHELSSSISYSKISSQQLIIKQNKRVQEQLDNVIIRNTKITKKDLDKFKFKDIYLTSQQALTLGIIDEILGM